MKKIFTYPEQQSKQYIHLDSDSGATTNEQSAYFLEEIHNGDFKTNDFQATPSSFTDVKKEWGKFYKYVDAKKSGANLQRYDFWKNPIIRCEVTAPYIRGIIITNADSELDSTTALIMKEANGAKHNMRNGAIMYAFANPSSSLDYTNTTFSTATSLGNSSSDVYCKVIDDYLFECYRYAEYDADGVVIDSSFAEPLTGPFIWTFHQFGDGDSHTFGQTGYNVWDTYPQLIQHPQRDAESLQVNQNLHFNATANSMMSKDWADSLTDNWFAPIRAVVKNLTGSTDDEEFHLLELDSEWTGMYDTPWVNTVDSGGTNYQMPGISDKIAALSYSPTFDYTASDDGGKLLITINSGTIPSNYRNGHPVNLTRADSFYATVGDRKAPRGGCGVTWFIDKKDDTSFWLTAMPYRTRTDQVYAKYHSEANVTNRWHSDSQSSSVSANAADIRFGSIMDEDFSIKAWPALFQPRVTNAVNGTYVYDRLMDRVNDVSIYGTGEMKDMYRVMGTNWNDPLPYYVETSTLVWPGNAVYQANVSDGSLDTTSWYVEGRDNPVVLQSGVGRYSSAHSKSITATGIAPVIKYSTDSNGRLATVTLENGGRLPYSYNGYDVTGDPNDALGRASDLSQGIGSPYTEQTSSYDILIQPPAEIVNAAATVYDRHLGDKSYNSQAWDAGMDKVIIANSGTGVESSQWNEGTNQYQLMDGSLYWPDHIAPRSANVTINQPSSVNNSANGIKYVRTSGYVKYSLDLEYPPMKEKDFARFLGFVNGMRGQTIPFRFPLQFINRFTTGSDGILFNTPNDPNHPGQSPRLYADVSAGDKRLFLEGYESNQTLATQAGQHFQIADSNRNGGLHTSLLQQDANDFGQVIVNTAYPVQISSNIAKGTEVNDNPKYVTVTMNADDFIYKTDYSGLYNFSVELVFDERKD